MSFERPTIAITGSTGVVGGLVAHELAGAGMPLRLLVRDPARAPELDRATVERAVYGEPTTALEGVELLFMVSASESATRLEEHLAFVDAAADAGVGHIVYTSFLGASADSTFHSRSRPFRDRAAHPLERHGLHSAARRVLPRLHARDGRRRSRDARPGG